MDRNSKIKCITATALFTALIFLSTAFIKFPITLGYVHVGDVFILLSSFMLPPVFSVIASALGSMFADILAGYVIYAPITLFAKGLMALVASMFFYKKVNVVRFLLGAIIGSIVMVASYFVFEGIMYGWEMAIVNLPMQFVQPAIAIVIGGSMIFAFVKTPYMVKLKDDITIKKAKRVPKE